MRWWKTNFDWHWHFYAKKKNIFFSSSRLIFPQVEEKKETPTMEIRFENRIHKTKFSGLSFV